MKIGLAVDTAVRCSAECANLKSDSKADEQPVQFSKKVDGIMLTIADVMNNTRKLVLYPLQSIQRLFESAVQQGVALV